MKLRFHAAALADLEGIHNHIAADSPTEANAVVQRILRSLVRLQDFPHSGRQGTVPGTQELVVPGLPYIAVYGVETDQITVVAVFHTAQNR